MAWSIDAVMSVVIRFPQPASPEPISGRCSSLPLSPRPVTVPGVAQVAGDRVPVLPGWPPAHPAASSSPAAARTPAVPAPAPPRSWQPFPRLASGCSGVSEHPWPLRRYRSRRPLPLASAAVPAGFPSPADDYIESQIDLHDLLVTSPASTFFMRASGDAMAAAGIFDGDLLVIDRSVEARPGRYVICTHAGAFLLRRLEGKPPRLWLVAMDGRTPALPLGEGSDAELWGVVVHAVHHLPAGRAALAVRTATMPE